MAAPGDPGNGMPLDRLGAPVKVDIAYGGSCTAGKREDFDRYHEVLAWGLAHGLRVPPSVRLYLQYGTTAVRDYCVSRGYDKTFEAAGARILQPLLRRLRQLQTGLVHRTVAGDGERHQPQFPRPLGSWPGLAGQSAHGDGQCAGGGADLVRRTAD